MNNPVNMSDPNGNWPELATGILNVIGGVAQMAAGAFLVGTSGWTGIGAVAGGLLFVNGAAVATQGVAQIVNYIADKEVLPDMLLLS